MFADVWNGHRNHRLLIGRHSESIFNNEGVFCGSMDVPLSSSGVLQAKNMFNMIKDEDIDVVFTSSMIRSKETAAILMQEYYEFYKKRWPIFVKDDFVYNEKYLPIFSDKRLNERCYGVLEGTKKKQAIIKYGNHQLFEWRRSWLATPTNGESLKSVCDRVRLFLDEKVKPLLNNKSVMIICHQNTMRAIRIVIDNICPDGVESIEFDNSQIIKYSYSDGLFKLVVG